MHAFAMENDLITADMVEVTEFPHLGNKYEVSGVPLTVINETSSVVGALPEQEFLEEALKALKD